MLRLTRGILLSVDSGSGLVRLGGARGLGLDSIILRLWVTLEGRVDEKSGMLVNVRDINEVLKESTAGRGVRARAVGDIISWAWNVLSNKFVDLTVVNVCVDVDERLRVGCETLECDMVLLTRKYEIAAGHCLRYDSWDNVENVEVFGKCSNPGGHGHNYVLEITVGAKGKMDIAEIDTVVEEMVLERFDHKNLNSDCSEFKKLMPTVENMVKVFWGRLKGQFGSAVELKRVAIWETPQTFAEYLG